MQHQHLKRYLACGYLLAWIPAVGANEHLLPDTVTVRASYAADSGDAIGGEVAWNAGERWRVRAGFDHYSGTEEHLISLIRFTENRERTDVGVYLDRKLAGDSGWYVAAGIIHPQQGTRWDANPEPRSAYTLNGRQYAGMHLDEPEGRVAYASLIPYVGMGWHSSARKGWQVGAEVGVLAGLDPEFSIHTANPFRLPYLEQDLQAEADKYLSTLQADTHLSGDQQLKASLSLRYHF